MSAPWFFNEEGVSHGYHPDDLRYLLAVYELMGSNAGVAAVEVSRRMGVSKPSVTRMLGVLAKRGLLVKEPYGKVRLTERGALLAQEYAVCVDMVQRRLPPIGVFADRF